MFNRAEIYAEDLAARGGKEGESGHVVPVTRSSYLGSRYPSNRLVLRIKLKQSCQKGGILSILRS